MAKKLIYSEQALKDSLELAYPQASVSKFLYHSHLTAAAEDMFCGGIALPKLDADVLAAALRDARSETGFAFSSHEAFLKATDTGDDVLDNLTKEDRFFAARLADFAVKKIVESADIDIEVNRVYTIRCPYDERLVVACPVTFVTEDGGYTAGVFNARLSSDNFEFEGATICYGDDNYPHEISLREEDWAAVRSERERLLEDIPGLMANAALSPA